MLFAVKNLNIYQTNSSVHGMNTIPAETGSNGMNMCNGVPRGVQTPPPQILTKYQKLRKFYYMK
jgi:hypothetical protein